MHETGINNSIKVNRILRSKNPYNGTVFLLFYLKPNGVQFSSFNANCYSTLVAESLNCKIQKPYLLLKSI